MPSGRYAPSPTGRLHLGNLRTALVAWLMARTDSSRFHLRFDDLDTASVRDEHYQTQLADLTEIGLDWDGEPVRQSDRTEHYRTAVAQLIAADVVYPCFCSRREIREATQAPNRPMVGRYYPGTCRQLDRAGRERLKDEGRPAALRVRTEHETIGFDDLVAGPQAFPVDDFVVQRNDGTPAYHLVTVVDDAAFDVECVTRADDLLDSSSRQLALGRLLGLPAPSYAHVPLVLGPNGDRLAKRHGSVTLPERVDRGESTAQIVGFLASSLGLCPPGQAVAPADLLADFDPSQLPTAPLTLTANGVA